MTAYLIVGVLCFFLGYYMGNKRFRQNVSNMIARFQNRGEDDFDYEDDDYED